MPLTNATSLIDRAKEVLRNQSGSAEELLSLARQLKAIQKFNLARRVLAVASGRDCDPDLQRKIRQQYSSCTEKDPDLPLERRYKRALDIIQPLLAEAEDYLRHPNPSQSSKQAIEAQQETFGIAAAIHKRRWQVDAQISHLIQAQELYEKGWQLGAAWVGPGIPDQGYTGINAAFVLDLLAQLLPDDPDLVAQRQQRAKNIREQIRSRLSLLQEDQRSDWWTLVTLAEACFGLRDYPGAQAWLRQAAAIEPPEPWEYETTVKQLARLAITQAGCDVGAEEFQRTEAWSVLSDFVGTDQAGLLTAFSGKVGLALSGGGFRASLFHIGVLARLAELDILRHIEVLSCVSGGSIIGALYYLEVRKLLERKPDHEIGRQDYINLVSGMAERFMTGIQNNPRMQVFSKLLQLEQRTEEMGWLLDETLYGPAAGVKPGKRPELRDVRICPPAGEEEINLPREQRRSFIPKYDNWRRAHKVPILIINATALNTGHNWQFTAAFMGESPNQIVPEVDANERLRRMYFDEKMPERHRNLPLGLAVAASAAVPGLFRPVQLAGLYPDRDIELVDGGVHDNQGIGGLLEQDCTVLLISDASGQLVAEPHPSRFETSVLSRSNNALMSRVRELEYRELRAKQEAGLLRDVFFIHLKKDLAVAPVDWVECDLAKESTESEGIPPGSSRLTSYGVRGDVQNLLAGIRTDLDAFSEAEAYALMSSGYRMTSRYFPPSVKSFTVSNESPVRWPFQQVDTLLSDSTEPSIQKPVSSQISDFQARLRLSAQLLFKAPQLLPYFPQPKWIAWSAVGFALLFPLICALVLGLLLLRAPVFLIPFFFALVVLGAAGLLFARGGLYWLTHRFDLIYLKKGSLKYLFRQKAIDTRAKEGEK